MAEPPHIIDVAYSGDQTWMAAIEPDDDAAMREYRALADLIAAIGHTVQMTRRGTPLTFSVDVSTVEGYPEAEAEISKAWADGAPLHMP